MNCFNFLFSDSKERELDSISEVFSNVYGEGVRLDRNLKKYTHIAIFSSRNLRWIIPLNDGVDIRPLKEWRPYGYFTFKLWKIIIKIYHRFPNYFRVFGFVPFSMSYINIKRKEEIENNFITYISSDPLTRKTVSFVRRDIHSESVLYVKKTPLTKIARVSTLREFNISEKLFAMKILKGPVFFEDDSFFCPYFSGSPSGENFSERHMNFLLKLVGEKSILIRDFVDDIFNNNIYLMSKYSIDKEAFYKDLDYDCLNIEVPSAFIHGDFCPWNIKHTESVLMSYDWEDGSEKGVVIWDLLHFLISVDFRINRTKSLSGGLFQNMYFEKYCLITKIDTQQILAIIDLYIKLYSLLARLKGEDRLYYYLSNYNFKGLVV